MQIFEKPEIIQLRTQKRLKNILTKSERNLTLEEKKDYLK